MSFALNLWLARAALLCGLLYSNVAVTKAGTDSQTAPSMVMFFHGTVTQIDAKHVTVSRALVGRPPESHTFLTNKKTKYTRSLRVKANVTVRYERLPEGDIALDIQVHPPPGHMQFSNPSATTADGSFR